jgi:Flp pilus assembly protein TadD
MRSRQLRLVLLAGLCSAVIGGCANLRGTGDGSTLGPATGGTASSSTNSDPISQAGVPTGKAAAGDSKASEQPGANLLESQFALARLSERKGEDQQAEHIYGLLLETAPQDARIHHRIGVMAIQKGDFARAEEHLHKAESLAPPTAELLSDIGYCYYLQQKLPEAEEALNRALKVDPVCAAAVNNLALVLGREGRFNESFDLFRRNNSEAEACANLAYVLAQNGESARAEQMYLRALTLNESLRAAAQAMMQLNDRKQTVSKLAPASPPPTNESNRGAEQAGVGAAKQASEQTSVGVVTEDQNRLAFGR